LAWLRSIKAKLILVYLAMAVPLAVLLSFEFHHQYRHRTEHIHRIQEDSSKLVAANTLGFIQGISSAIDTAGHAIAGSNMQAEAANEYLGAIKDHYPAITTIDYADPSGNIIASSNTNMIDKNISSLPCFERITTENHIAVSDFQENPDGSHGFVITSSLSEDGRLAAIIVASVDSSKLGTIVPGKKTDCNSIIDSKGIVIFHNKKPKMPDHLRDWGKFDLIQKALSGQITRTSSFICPVDNKKHFAVQVPIKELGWSAGSSIEVDSALIHTKKDIAGIGFLYALIFILASGLALFVGKSISNPVIELANKARLIGEEKLEEPIEIKTGDEIEILASELDAARAKLLSSFRSTNVLLAASSGLNRSLDIAEIVSSLSETLTQLLDMNRVVVSSFDPKSNEVFVLSAKHALHTQPGQRCSVLNLPSIYQQLYATKQPIIIDAEDTGLDKTVKEFLDEREVKSLLLYPLLIGERIVGHLVLDKRGQKHEFTVNEVRLVESIAAQAAIAIENARLYTKEHAIAETLQQALLTIPPELPGIEISHIYEAAMGESRIGGDFYDLFEVADGKVAFVIGDVSGKGIKAATTTSIVKNTIRAFAYNNQNTSEIISKTNDVVYKQIERNQFITAILGILDIKSGRLEVTSAGHPDIIICSKNGCKPYNARRNTPLGAFPGVIFEKSDTGLSYGDTIIFYTDGLIEARSNGELFGEERVVETINNMMPASPGEIINELIDSAKSFSGGNLLDDVAVVSLQLIGGRDTGGLS